MSTESTQPLQPSLKKLSCRTVLLSIFMDALIEDDRSIISEDEWMLLLHEFYESSGNKSFSATYFIYRDIDYLETKIEIINKTVEALRKLKHESLYKVLENYDFYFDWNDSKSLDRVIKRTKLDVIQLQQLIYTWNKQPNKEGTKEDLYNYFDSWLDAISDSAGYIIGSDKIMLSDFCRRMCNLQKKADASRYTNRPNI
jgi:hypothetical protein